MHVVGVSLCIYLHSNLETVTDIYFLLGSYVNGEHSRTSLHVKVISQDHFSWGSRSLNKVTSCSAAGSKIRSTVAPSV